MKRTHDSVFAHALLDPAAPLPPGLLAPDGCDPARRYDVYRNNVVAGLIDALVEGFPALLGLLGDDSFRTMARLFVTNHPPGHPVLSRYGAALPGFLERFERFARWPWLGDVARLELARRQAHDAADRAPTAEADLAASDPDRVHQLVPCLHPSVRIVRSRWPVIALWRAGLGDAVPDLRSSGADVALVVRPQMTVGVHRLAEGGHPFLDHCDGRATLGEVAKATLAIAPTCALPDVLALAVASGAVCAFLESPTT